MNRSDAQQRITDAHALNEREAAARLIDVIRELPGEKRFRVGSSKLARVSFEYEMRVVMDEDGTFSADPDDYLLVRDVLAHMMVCDYGLMRIVQYPDPNPGNDAGHDRRIEHYVRLGGYGWNSVSVKECEEIERLDEPHDYGELYT